MIRIGICDDSHAFLQQTKFMIEHWDQKPQNLKVEPFEDADSLLHAHAKSPFDIILLDIVMPLFNGMEAAKELREKDKTTKIVFLTSSVEFAIDSYSVKASNYLLKPVEPARLFNCLKELIDELNLAVKSISVKSIDSVHKILMSEIEFVESQGKLISFNLAGGEIIKSHEPLYSFEDKLSINDGFYKCHRSYIVNINAVKSYTAKEIVMQSGAHIPISRNCHKDFEAVYFSTIFGEVGAFRK